MLGKLRLNYLLRDLQVHHRRKTYNTPSLFFGMDVFSWGLTVCGLSSERDSCILLLPDYPLSSGATFHGGSEKKTSAEDTSTSIPFLTNRKIQ